MNSGLQVIFGAGQVGSTLAELLVAEGNRVRLVKRSPGGAPNGVELMLGDATDAAFCRQACQDVTVVYHCMNPVYIANVWETVLPRYMENLIAAAGSVGARLVVLDNLYMLGRTGGKPMNEQTPSNPCSKKGEVRARVADQLFDAHLQGRVSVVCGRAADFYGPRGKMTLFGDYFWKPVLAGKTAMSPANLDMIHTYHYIPDVARGLATLGAAKDDVLGQAWMLPCQPAVTTREQARRFEPYLGHPAQLGTMPRWMLTGLGWFVPMMRELSEMTYQWDEPFVVDDSHFRSRFDFRPLAVNEASRATVVWAKKAYGQKG